VAVVPFPDASRNGPGHPEAVLHEVERLLGTGAPNGDPIGAVVVEPVQGRGGIRLAPDGFFEGLTERAREAGALVVADEVFTGCGRTGSFLASERVGLEPDLVCLGKALGGGFPLSACAGPARVMNAWPPSPGEALHTSTFLGHPVSCAASLAFLERLRDDDVAGRARERGARLRAMLEEALGAAPGVGEVRGLGLMLGVELVDGDAGSEPADGRAAEVAVRALAEGVLVLPAGDRSHVVELTPPVTLTDEQMEAAVDVLARAVREVGSS
jgi:4-aminobutyrate aminotransferase-like enzyme